MTSENGFDELSPLPIQYEADGEEWRALLAGFQQLRQASLFEIKTLTDTPEPRTGAVMALIARHEERVDWLSHAIADLLDAARTEAE
jgi:hypothetical protein